VNWHKLQHPAIPSAIILFLLAATGTGIKVANSLENQVNANTLENQYERAAREKAEVETQRKLDKLSNDSDKIQDLLNQILLRD